MTRGDMSEMNDNFPISLGGHLEIISEKVRVTHPYALKFAMVVSIAKLGLRS